MKGEYWTVQVNIPEEVYELDRLHFAENPASLSYIRYYVPGELSEIEEAQTFAALKETEKSGPRMVRVLGAFGRPLSRQYYLQYPDPNDGKDLVS